MPDKLKIPKYVVDTHTRKDLSNYYRNNNVDSLLGKRKYYNQANKTNNTISIFTSEQVILFHLGNDLLHLGLKTTLL